MTDATPLASEQITKPAGPDRIYLQPECGVDWSDNGRQWCEDDVWEECGEPGCKCKAVVYVREDLAALSATPVPSDQDASQAQEDTVAFVQEWLMSSDHPPTQWDRDFAAAIDARAAAPKQAEPLDAATVERCAQVAEAETGKYPHGNMMYGPSVGPKIAKAIRALATDPHQHGGKGA